MTRTYDGIDYGNGKTNIDTETGIRFGIVHVHRLADWFWEETEVEYPPEPECDDSECDDGDCDACEAFHEHSQPIGHTITDPKITASVDADGDVWVFKSNYVARGTFCSPCAPGAVSIGTPGGIPCYCLPPDWYADGERPEGISRVE